MKIEQNISMHNKFKLELRDAKTGKLKQEAYAYNLITDAFFADFTDMINHNNRANLATCINYICLGSGTGTLDPARTDMFNKLGYYGNSTYETGPEAKDTYVTKKIVLSETTLANTTITEVGLWGYDTDPSYNQLHTHALIEDSEGNPISVQKGENDILTVYSTFYVSCADGDGWKFIDKNGVYRLLIGSDLWWAYNHTLYVGGIRTAGNEDCESSIYNNLVTPGESSITRENNNRTLKFVYNRIAAGSGNADSGINEIGFNIECDDHIYPTARLTFPVAGVWEGTTLTGETIGTGDGVETNFNFRFDEFKLGTETIYVDGTPQTRDVDYTVKSSFKLGANTLRYTDLSLSDMDMHLALKSIAFQQANFKNAPNGLDSDLIADYGQAIEFSEIYFNNRGGYYEIFYIKVYGSDDASNWTELLNKQVGESGSGGDYIYTHQFPGGAASYRYWKIIIGGADSSGADCEGLALYSEKSNIKFTTPPTNGAVITADYDVYCIPKDENHVLDLTVKLNFVDANAS